LIIGLTTWTGGILLYYFGLKTTKASVATICELMYPISAIIFDYVLNWTKFSIVQILSVGIILYSIYQLSINQSEANKNFH
jgi:drug/metabolite transporter (DMT)-like permease